MKTKGSTKKLSSQCLLLKTPDQRCFFTEESNFPILVEFGRLFDAEISVVKTKEQVEVLGLDELAKNISVQPIIEYPEYEVLEKKLIPAPNKYSLDSKKPTNTSKIEEVNPRVGVTKHIKDEFLKGNIVSLEELVTKFPKFTKASLSGHLTRAKRELSFDGKKFNRLKPGVWKMSLDDQGRYLGRQAGGYPDPYEFM